MMEKKDNHGFFPRGILRLNSDKKVSNSRRVPTIESAARISLMNTPQELYERFVKIEPIFRKNTAGGLVETLTPSTQYSAVSLMVVAIPNEIVGHINSGGHDRIETQNIFAYPDDSKQEYYLQTLCAIKAMEQARLGNDLVRGVMAYENTTLSVSTTESRVSRSLVLPHVQIVQSHFPLKQAQGLYFPPGYALESKWLQDENQYSEFVHTLSAELASVDDLENIEVLQRSDKPYGYTLMLSSTKDGSLSKESKRLSKLLIANDKALAQFLPEKTAGLSERSITGTNRKTIILQPTYRTYIYFVDGLLRVTISPEILAPLGSLENLGFEVSKGPDEPVRYSKEEIESHSIELINVFKNLLAKAHEE